MALKKVKGNLERLFDKNLTDLVRGIRNNKENEAKYIAQCIEEIKVELRQDNIAVKANAVAKLTYLQMLGYDISWAVFNIIEVMSSNKFTYKRIGYLAASQSFHSESELLMLTTNMIRKELNSSNQYEAGLALSGLSCFVSADLARDLANDIMTLMSSTKPYLRMKAVLMMYKVFLKYPEALRPAFPRLREKLEDPDPGVQSAAVNVVCELARKNPKNYLSLAPIFFKLMTTSTNNWMLIKIIKLLGTMTHLDPELGRKITQPLVTLICSTSAMSLLYECINTVIAVLISISSGMPNDSGMPINLCVQKLSILIEDSDQNLKYLGLLAMSKILKTHPKSVQAHKDLILQCLDDKDESIRMRALGLLYGMVSRKNLMEIVKKLMVHMEGAEGTLYRDELLKRIVEICSQNDYQFITNFEWYVTVLVELTQMETAAKYGKLLSEQLVDVCVRVHAIRSFAVGEMATLLESWALGTGTGGALPTVLCSAAYIVGEYASDPVIMNDCIRWLMEPGALPGPTRAAYLHAALKLFAKLLQVSSDVQQIQQLCDLMSEKIQLQLCSAHIEVQERASCGALIVKLVRDHLGGNVETEDGLVVPQAELLQGLVLEDGDSSNEKKSSDVEMVEPALPASFRALIKEMMELFSGELNPVAPKAQKKVPIPDGLDLDSWINTPPESSASSSDAEGDGEVVGASVKKVGFMAPSWGEPKEKALPEPTADQIQKMKEARQQAQLHNPHYLKSTSNNNTSTSHSGHQPIPDADSIPIAEIALEVPLTIHEKRSDKYLAAATKSHKKEKRSSKKGKRSKKNKYEEETDSDADGVSSKWVVSTAAEVPEGWVGDADGASDVSTGDGPPDPHQALNIDLNIPLRGEEEGRERREMNRGKDTIIHTSLKSHTGERDGKKKNKDNKHIREKEKGDVNNIISSNKDHKKKRDKERGSREDEEDRGDKQHHHRKEGKERKPKDDKKKKKSSKKDKPEAKVGYEEALGISTPSKEFT